LLPSRAFDALGGLDIIINNAGMTDTTGLPLTELSVTSFDKLVALNLTAVDVICAAAADLLAPGAAIVNLASGASWRPLALRGPYSATKAGILALTRAFADTFASRGITVCAVAPGYTLTPLVQSLADQGLVDLDQVAAAIPLGRIARPEDIAAAVAFMVSPDGCVLSGETLLVDGGGLAGPPPLKHGAPHAGTFAKGAVAMIAAPDGADDDTIIRLANSEQIETAGPLNAIMDFTPMTHPMDAQTLLSHMRDMAICASRAQKTADFCMLFVLSPGKSAKDNVAIEAAGMLAKTLALEWAPAGLRVNALEWRGSHSEQLLQLCHFLISEDASLVTGQFIRSRLTDGGLHGVHNTLYPGGHSSAIHN
jgi:NAD(P)-dependent dehydrogenase (short-subunit alcohol dehydrogenase family)